MPSGATTEVALSRPASPSPRGRSRAVILSGALAAGCLMGLSPTYVHAVTSARLNATPVRQSYNLDCEATALQIALSILGVSESQDWLLNRITADTRPPVLSNGRPVQWGDPYQAFVGDVRGQSLTTGYGVYYPPVVTAARAAGVEAVGGEGYTPQQLYDEVSAGHPVIVWAPHRMNPVSIGQWTTWQGRTVWYSPQEHTQVLVGFDYGSSTVTLANPADGQIESFSMSLFENRLAAFRDSAVILAPPGGVHLGALDFPSRGAAAIAVDGGGSWVMRPATGAFGPVQQLSNQAFYGSRATVFANLTGLGHGVSGVAVNDSSVWVMTNNNGSAGAIQRWSNTRFYGSRATVVADLDGRGFASVVAINNDSIWVLRNTTGTGFSAPQEWSNSSFFGNRGTYIADLDGHGQASAVAITDTSIWVMPNRSATSSFGPPQRRTNTAFYGNRGTFMADMDGHGFASAVAINDDSVWVAHNAGTGSFASPAAWSRWQFYGTWNYLADVDGSGRASAVAVDRSSIWVERNTGGSLAAPARWSAATFYGGY